jgi:O-antigen ligase
MLGMNVVKARSIERVGVPRLPVFVGLLVALVLGYLAVTNGAIALGLAAMLILFIWIASYPAMLVAVLIGVSVLVESTLRSVTVSVGGQELLNFNGVVNCGLIGATILYMAAGRIRPFQSLISRSFLLYCVAVVASLLFSVDPLLTVRSAIRISAAYCLYLIVTQVLTEKHQIDRAVRTLVMISIVPITVGLYELAFVNHFKFSRDLRVESTFATGMSYAMYLALVLPYVFGQIFFARGRPARKGLLAAIFLAGLLNLAYNPTRIAWGVFAFAMVLYAALANPRKFLPPILIVLLILIVAFFPLVSQYFGGFFKTGWKTYLSDNTSWDVKSPDYRTVSSLHIRVFVWKNMLREVLRRNVIFGAGSGTWFDYQDRRTMGFSLASHSDYFEVVYGTGVLGLLTYLLFRIKQVTLLARFARSDAERTVKLTVLFPCLLTHIACLGMSVTEVWQSYSGIYWLSWITFGISEAYYRCCLKSP